MKKIESNKRIYSSILIFLTLICLLAPLHANATVSSNSVQYKAKAGETKTYNVTENIHYSILLYGNLNYSRYSRYSRYSPQNNSKIIVTVTKTYAFNISSNSGYTGACLVNLTENFHNYAIANYNGPINFIIQAFTSSSVKEFVKNSNRANLPATSAWVSGNNLIFANREITKYPYNDTIEAYVFRTTSYNWKTGWLEYYNYTSIGKILNDGNYNGKIQFFIELIPNSSKSSSLYSWQITDFLPVLVVMSVIMIRRRKKID